MGIDLRFDSNEAALLIDLYELTMAASFFQIGYNEPACFSLSVRRMPVHRGFLVAAGIERLLEALEEFRFDQSAIDYLDSLKLFEPEFLNFLGNLRFTGEIFAMAEGTLFFAEEPILEVNAPLIEAQLLETLVMNQIGVASLIATRRRSAWSLRADAAWWILVCAAARASMRGWWPHARAISAVSSAPRTCLLATATEFRSTALWRTATSWRMTVSAKPSNILPSFSRSSAPCWLTLMTRSVGSKMPS
jgi:putative nicotinate phosphoribosyltransferase